MKNKRGFTLIELLAVIVILAIIALIAVPIVLNMIESARKSAARSAALGYIDAIEYENGFVELEQEGYTKITSGDVSTINTTLGNHIKGKKPTSGSVVVDEKGKVSSATNLCFNGYSANYDGQDVTVTKGCSGNSNNNNNNQEPSIPEPVSFSTDSWETIANNTTSSVYEVGQEREVIIGSNSYTVRIANNTTPNVCKTNGYSQTACGFVIEFVDIVGIRQMGPDRSNAGGWDATTMRTYLNGDFYNSLPSDLKSVIISTNPVVSGSGSGKVSPNTNDKVYLLSGKEVGLDLEYDNKKNVETDTRILDYYNDNNSDNSRIKKNLDNSIPYWWLRTPNSSGNDDFIRISPSGGYGYADVAYYSYGVAPAFRIGVNQ